MPAAEGPEDVMGVGQQVDRESGMSITKDSPLSRKVVPLSGSLVCCGAQSLGLEFSRGHPSRGDSTSSPVLESEATDVN